MTILLLLGSFWLSLIAFLVVQFNRAPHGYQDDQGFHFAETPSVAKATRRPVATSGVRRHGLGLIHGFPR